MAVDIAGQDFGGGPGGTNQKIVVDDSMSHLVGQHAFMQVGTIYVYGVVFMDIPGSEPGGRTKITKGRIFVF